MKFATMLETDQENSLKPNVYSTEISSKPSKLPPSDHSIRAMLQEKKAWANHEARDQYFEQVKRVILPRWGKADYDSGNCKAG